MEDFSVESEALEVLILRLDFLLSEKNDVKFILLLDY